MFSFLIGKHKKVKGEKKSPIVKDIFNTQRLKSIKTTIFLFFAVTSGVLKHIISCYLFYFRFL